MQSGQRPLPRPGRSKDCAGEICDSFMMMTLEMDLGTYRHFALRPKIQLAFGREGNVLLPCRVCPRRARACANARADRGALASTGNSADQGSGACSSADEGNIALCVSCAFGRDVACFQTD